MARRKKKMIFFIVGVVLVVAALAAGGWLVLRPSLGGCNPPLPRKTIAVGKASFDAEMATTITEQACGLSGRESLSEGDGMFFTFDAKGPQNFWMKDMKFAIDMIWISGNKVVGFAKDAQPPEPTAHLWNLKIYNSPGNVDKVLEVPAGTVERDGIQIGDLVSGF